MLFEKAILKYQGKSLTFQAGKPTFADDLYVEYTVEKTGSNILRARITIHPKVPIIIEELSLHCSHPYQWDEAVFCNGYQSWTESREFHPHESIPNLRKPARRFMGMFGDYLFTDYSGKSGELHSWTYTYIRKENRQVIFCGSLSENTGFTNFHHQCRNHQLRIEKDCRGLHLDHSYPAFDILIFQGSEKEAFDYYKNLHHSPLRNPVRITGWTSWYRHFTNISAEKLEMDLRAAGESPFTVQYFQIDDGHQKRVGDWLQSKESFPEGMKAFAWKIHQKGMKAGIWLAPFICEKRSNLFTQKPHWLLKNSKGKPVIAGYNPMWSGWFYALDIYNKEVRDYLSQVFFTVLNQWNYDLVKVDFLYAAALNPPLDKTRGQVMNEAMLFLRNLVGEKVLLACGVPLASAFGLADYCRIGADVHLKWENRFMKFLRYRERVSTAISLECTISRWQLNGRFFGNDPDVFLLRTTENKLTEHEKKSLFILNLLLGSVMFTSDSLDSFSEETTDFLKNLFPLRDSEILEIDKSGVFVKIRYLLAGKTYLAVWNQSNAKEVWVSVSGPVSVKAHETIIEEIE